MAIFESFAEDLVLLPHPALTCNKAWKVPLGPGLGTAGEQPQFMNGKGIRQMRD